MFCASIFSGDRCGKDFPFSLSMSWEYRIMVTISVYPLLAAEYSDDQPFCPQRFMICKVSKAYSTEDKSIHVPSSVCWGQPHSPVALRRILFGCWWRPTSRPFVDPRYIVYYAKIKKTGMYCVKWTVQDIPYREHLSQLLLRWGTKQYESGPPLLLSLTPYRYPKL